MSIISEYGRYIPVCDVCGKSLPAQDYFEDAVQVMQEEGWTSVRLGGGEYENMCEDC